MTHTEPFARPPHPSPLCSHLVLFGVRIDAVGVYQPACKSEVPATGGQAHGRVAVLSTPPAHHTTPHHHTSQPHRTWTATLCGHTPVRMLQAHHGPLNAHRQAGHGPLRERCRGLQAQVCKRETSPAAKPWRRQNLATTARGYRDGKACARLAVPSYDLGRVCTGGGRTYHWRRRRAVQKTVALVSVRPVSAAGRHSLLDKRQSALAACKRCIADRAPLATVVYRSCRLRSAPTGRQKGEGVASSPRPHTHSGAHHQHAYRATNACSTSRRS